MDHCSQGDHSQKGNPSSVLKSNGNKYFKMAAKKKDGRISFAPNEKFMNIDEMEESQNPDESSEQEEESEDE